METIKEIYKIGQGPSSSHTMGPRKAAEQFLARHPNDPKYRITLFGSLAATGKGHLTGEAIEEAFADKNMELVWEPTKFLAKHPNALTFESFDNDDNLIESWTAYSVGGGSIVDDNSELETESIYGMTTMDDILAYCQTNNMRLWEYVEECEGDEIWDYLKLVWETMVNSIKRGMEKEGILPGQLKLTRKAPTFQSQSHNFSGPNQHRTLLFAYALAVNEENASGGIISTAPTCGASGTLPAVLYYQKRLYKLKDSQILKALATAGLIGNLVKWNASISGAEAGCQAEVGTGCAMASAAATQLLGGTNYQIEYAAEMGLEHHLGLTCDPLYGLVQVPCIERNAFASSRALSHASYALLSDGRHVISFDKVVRTMKETGLDLPDLYKETSLGGLAIYGK
ncbi:L-serine ammonia-lyase [Balneicella halophila]|uniref:L-serine dehydratase n=1 Tax=Balneicella halophila TaxID=1537566 RepID=A0A7L4UR69_BALHA|nr:L-serine ammonia-lyase [Balneicella halophila]PVX50799.1 L-serine ammonia-lyase [Balneicella halophila]